MLCTGDGLLRELGSIGFCIVKDCLALTVGIRADCGCFLLGIAQHLLGSLFGLLDFAEYI